MKTGCIIIEDEPLAMERMTEFVGRVPHLRLLATFESGKAALAFLEKNRVPLMFLDINLDDLSGIQLLETLKRETEVVITTAYDEYALKGYDLNVTDYLLKPFTFDRFMQAVNKAGNNISKNTLKVRDYIFIRTEYRLEKVALDDILYIEGMRDYRRIHTKDRRIMTLQTFRDLERELPKNMICRVHKSFMVSLNKIVSVQNDRIRLNGVVIPISETYKREFMELINH